MVDVVIVGGGTAGLSAALVLGRARRNTLVVDAGQPRNAPAASAHGMLTRDGTPPGELLRIGREELKQYPSVRVVNDTVVSAANNGDSFDVGLASGDRVRTRKIILAVGLRDEFPDIAGIEQFWGETVLHCPYCHGWEVRDQPWAYMADGPAITVFGGLLLGWTRDLVYCANGSDALTAEQRDQLTRNGIGIREQRIRSVTGMGRRLKEIVFDDGTVLERSALYIRTVLRPQTDLAAQLGCAHSDDGLVTVDMLGATSVAGVYAAGDLITPFQQVVRAAASGATAAAGVNHNLAEEDFARPTISEGIAR